MDKLELLTEQYKNCCAENDALKSENARYRDALTFIAEGNIAQSSIWVNDIDEAYQQIAIEALKGE